MRLVSGSAVAVSLALSAAMLSAQAGQTDASKAVAGGGVFASGWTGKTDDSRENTGLKLEDSLFKLEGQTFHVKTGPSATYWNPANKAAGNYTVKGTFNEPEFMGLNTHAHPYGIVIAGSDMGTPQMTALYCEAYGDGRFIVRGFGPAAFQMNGRQGEANPAVHKAEAKGKPVTQEIAMTVKGDQVTCSINGTVVGTYDKASLVGEGKLKSLDGVYGLRFAHNTEGFVTGFGMSK